MNATQTTITITSINPLHDVNNPNKLASLTADMQVRGWIGRPLLVEIMGDGYQAWTGSHRIAAARAAGLDRIPVLVVDSAAIVEQEGEPADGQPLASLASDDDCKTDMLRRAGLTDAADLMATENND